MIARILAYFGYQLVPVATLRANTEEREAAGAMIAHLAQRWNILPTLPTSVPTPFADAAGRFLASVGLDGRGQRVSDAG